MEGDVRGRLWWGHLKQGSKCGGQSSGHVSQGRAAPAVNLYNWEDLSVQRIPSTVDQIMWPRFLGRLATGSSACVGESCGLTLMSTSSRPVGQIIFVGPWIVHLSPGSVCFHGVFRRARMGRTTE